MENETVSFAKLTIKEVEQLVGRKAVNVETKNKEVVLTFAGQLGKSICSADTRVHIKKW